METTLQPGWKSPEVSCSVVAINEGEDNDGPLESTDLFLTGRGISLLVNVTVSGVVTYSLGVDGVPTQHGYIGEKRDVDDIRS